MDNYRATAGWKAFGQDINGKWSCPGVFVSSPNNQATVSGTVEFSAFAANAGAALSELQLYVDGTLVPGTITDYTQPRSTQQVGMGTTYTWNTTHVSNGTHTLEAKASNGSGASASASITVTVQNP